jgi:cytoskeleton protein RodZ
MAPAQLSAPAAAPSGEAAQLRFVFAKESWVEVRDRDNKVVFSQRNPAGVEQSLGGQGPLSVVIGNAPGVALFWRGQAVDLAPHTKGEVARLVLE